MSQSGFRDPALDGPRTFDGNPHRLAMALACRDQPVEWKALGDASGQSEGNGRKSGQTLCRWGVLREIGIGGGKSGLRLRKEWRGPVAEAELRALKGCVGSENMLLLIRRPGVASFYRLIADRDAHDYRIAWVTRLPHHSTFGLIILLTPSLDEDQIERLTIELDDAGVEHERLLLGKMAGHSELREFAASSLPGAYGPGS